MLGLLQKLTAAAAPSGQEDKLRDLIQELLPTGWQGTIDFAGNLLVTPKEGCTPILLATPMDEISCLVNKAQEEGLLSLIPATSFDPRVLPGRAVNAGKFCGVIGTKAVHMQSEEERGSAVPFKKLYLDIGAKDKTEAEALLPAGTAVTFRGETRAFGNHCVSGRVLDARLGAAVLLALLTEGDFPCPVSFFFAAQNLTDGQGAQAYAAVCPAQTVLVVEARKADKDNDCRLGGGVILPIMDKRTVYPPALFQKAAEAAGDMPIQYSAPEDAPLANAFLRGGGGRTVMTIGIPCRYPRTPLPVANLDDCQAAVAYLRRLLTLL